MAHTLKNCAASYVRLWDGVQINRDRRGAVTAVADRILGLRSRYESVAVATGVPWFIIALIHKMESDLDFTTHLHNGDSLKKRTWQVPAGRPKTGSPPFTWEESAVDAIRYEKLDRIKLWTLEQTCFALETYNGFGSRNHGVPSAYLWSFTNRYVQGKYVKDKVWDSHAVSQQSGAMAVLKLMMEKDQSIKLGVSTAADPVPVDEKERLPKGHHILRLSKTLYGAVLAFFGAVYTTVAPALNWFVEMTEDLSGFLKEAFEHATEWKAPADAALSLMGTSLPWLGFAALSLGTLIVFNARISAWYHGKVG